MISQRIKGYTREIAKSQPEYSTLCIRDVVMKTDHDVHIMQSSWELTPGELALLNAGGYIILSIMGTVHPPVLLQVDPPSAEDYIAA